MPSDSTTTGTSDQATGTGTAPATGTGTAQGPADGAAQGQASNGSAGNGEGNQATRNRPTRDDLAAELQTAQARIRELEQASMTEAERRDHRLAELEAERAAWEVERQSMVLRHAVWQEALKAGAVYPDLVVSAVNPAQVEWAKDGSPSNIGKVVSDARQAYPALFRAAPGTADGGAGQGAGAPAPTMNDLIRRGVGRA